MTSSPFITKIPRISDAASLIFFVMITALSVSCHGGKYLQEYREESHQPTQIITKPEQITAGTESNFAPNLSPNGAYVIYTSDKTGNKDLWEKSTYGGYLRQLTFHSADDFNPVLNPTGDKIAFVSRREDATGDIAILNLGGISFSLGSGRSSEKKIRGINLPLSEETTPEWFPDSNFIVFASRMPGEKTPQIMLANIDTLSVRPLDAKGDQPSVSPDGKQIVYVKDGALLLYNLDTEKTHQLTEGGYLQDGQPRFTPDGRGIVFIRYGDDTNNDGYLNADDKSSVWRIDVNVHNMEKLRENYRIYPLTSAFFSGYYPQIRGGSLYLTLQTGNSLDIFKVPANGQITPASDLKSLKHQLDNIPDATNKIYLLRLAEAQFYSQGESQLSVEVSLMLLDFLSKSKKNAEFLWAHKKFISNYKHKTGSILFSDLLANNLSLRDFKYGMNPPVLTPDQLLSLNNVDESVTKILGSSDSEKENLKDRIDAYGLFLKSQILAVRKDYFKSYHEIGKLLSSYPNQNDICAEAELFMASILTNTSDLQNALQKIKNIVEKYPLKRSIALAAGQLASDLIELEQGDKIELLTQFRSDTKSLPVLPAVIHTRIADIYEKQGNMTVYANELRQIIDLYPDSPEIVLPASEKLIGLEEAAERYESIASRLLRLSRSAKTADMKARIKELLSETMIHHGEHLIRKGRISDSSIIFQRVLELKRDHISAHRGLIDCSFKLGKIEEIIEQYGDQAKNNPQSALSAYNYGYALTYIIDGEQSPRLKLAAIDEAIDQIERARSIDSQVIQIHQTLGWLYFQRGYWQDRYFKSGATIGKIKQRANMVFDFFGRGEPNWLQQSIESYQTAYFLSRENSFERITLALNLAQTYYELKNFQKSLTYYLERIKKIKEVPLRDPKSEAFMLRKAGRSAFQTDELALAVELQREALSHFETINDEEGVNYSLDALALTLREMKNYKDSLSLYERLEANVSRGSQTINHISVLSNIGYCHYSLGNLDRSLNYFNLAEEKLESITNTSGNSTNEDSSSIKVDLGGQGSASKGFDLQARGSLLLSFKADIYGRMGRRDLQLESLRKKLDLLSTNRKIQIEDHGKSEKYLAEEISILQNNIGMLELDLGFQGSAQKYFQESELMAKNLRPNNQIYKSKGELINSTNAHRLELRVAALGLSNDSDINAAIIDLENTANLLKKSYEDGAKDYATYITNSLGLATNFRQVNSSPIASIQKNFIDQYNISYRGDISNTLRNKTVLAYNSFEKDISNSGLMNPVNKQGDNKSAKVDVLPHRGHLSRNQGIENLISESKEELSQNIEYKWKINVLNHDYDAALLEIESNLDKGIPLKNPVDRHIYRYLQELKLRASLTKDDTDTFNALRHLINRRNVEIVVRNLPQKFENNNNSDDFNGLRDWLKGKPTDEVLHSIGPQEHALIFYRFLNGDLIAFTVSSKGINRAKSDLISGHSHQDWTQERDRVTTALTSLVENSIHAHRIPSGDFIYIIPPAELHDIPWEDLRIAGVPLKIRNPISFIPSVDLIPYYLNARRLPSTRIGWLNNSRIEQKEEESWLAKALDSSQTIEEIRPNGQRSIMEKLYNYNIVHISIPIKINPFETAETTILANVKKRDVDSESILEEPAIDSYKDDFLVIDFLKYKNSQLLTLVFEDTIFPKEEKQSIGEGQDGWVYLAITTLRSGIPSIILNKYSRQTPDYKFSDSESTSFWRSFYRNLSTSTPVESVQKLNSHNTRLYGYFGIKSSDTKSFAAEKISETIALAEDAYDDGNYSLAANLFKDAHYYKDVTGKLDNETLDRIVESLVQGRNYSEALRFKLIATSRLKPTSNGIAGTERDPIAYGDSLIESAVLAVRAKKNRTASALLNDAEKIFQSNSDFSKLGKIDHYRGINAENQNDFEQTISWYKKSQDFFQKINSPESIQRSLNIGNIYNTRLSEYAKAIEYYDQAEEGFKKLGSKDFLPVLVDKASVLSSIGQIEEGAVLLERVVLPQIQVEKDRDLWIRSTQLLANFYMRLGLLSKAAELNSKTIQEASKLDDPVDKLKGVRRTIDAINLKGYILSAMGNYTEGFEEFKNAIDLAEKNDLKSQLAVLFNNYGFWAREYGAVDDSLKFFDIALKYDEELKSKSGIAFDQRNIALSSILKGDYNRARELLLTSLKTSEEMHLIYNVIYCQFGLGDIALRERKFEEAKMALTKVFEISHKNNFKEFEWKSLAALAEVEYQQKNWRVSADFAGKAIAIIESLRAGLKSESSPSNLQSEKGVQEVYHVYAVSLFQSGNTLKSWQVAEKARGRAFLDSIASKNLELARTEVNDLIKEELNLRRIQESQKALYQRLKSIKAPAEKVKVSKNILDETINKRVSLIRKMYQKDRKIIDFVINNTITLKDAQNKIRDDQGILEYFITRDFTISWLITKNEVKHSITEHSRLDLSKKISDFRTLIQNYSSTEYLGEDLSKILIAPFVREISNLKKIIIVPHRDLHFLSFAALPLDQDFLVDKVSISYLDSASALRFISENTKAIDKNSSIIAFANPRGGPSLLENLPFAEKEADVIKRYFKNVEVIKGQFALESSFKNNLNYDIIHIGAHGEYYEKSPESSHLVFARDGQDDGYLTVKEIFNKKMQAKIVTLSACDSGMGEISSGDEVVAMNRAFLFAGASTVVSALWRINDVTSAVTMKRFYRNLSEGMSKDEALLSAQKTVRQYFKHPGYWAPFKLNGDWN